MIGQPKPQFPQFTPPAYQQNTDFARKRVFEAYARFVGQKPPVPQDPSQIRRGFSV